jgi:hypothetical protein
VISSSVSAAESFGSEKTGPTSMKPPRPVWSSFGDARITESRRDAEVEGTGYWMIKNRECEARCVSYGLALGIMKFVNSVPGLQFLDGQKNIISGDSFGNGRPGHNLSANKLISRASTKATKPKIQVVHSALLAATSRHNVSEVPAPPRLGGSAA